MNVLLLGTLALSSFAGTADATKTEGEWLGLDQEIQNLATSLNTTEGIAFSGLLRARYVNSSDFDFSDEGLSSFDISGFSVTNARLVMSGAVGNYGFRVEEEFASGFTSFSPGFSEGGSFSIGSNLLDAYAYWNCGDNLTVTFGQFKVPFSRGFLTDRGHLAFLDRPILNQDFPGALGYFGYYYGGLSGSGRDTGIQLSGNMDAFDWWVAVQNGADSIADDYRLTARAEVDVVGDGVAAHQGGYGIGDDTAVNIGLGYSDDSGLDNAFGLTNTTLLTLDARVNANPITADIAIFDLDEDVGDATPWNISFGYMFTPDEWEGNLRYEDLDDSANTSLITVNVTWYMGSPTHKWQFEVVSIDSDSSFLDGTLFQGGLTLGY